MSVDSTTKSAYLIDPKAGWGFSIDQDVAKNLQTQWDILCESHQSASGFLIPLPAPAQRNIRSMLNQWMNDVEKEFENDTEALQRFEEAGPQLAKIFNVMVFRGCLFGIETQQMMELQELYALDPNMCGQLYNKSRGVSVATDATHAKSICGSECSSVTANFLPTDVLGAEHFIRIFVKLPNWLMTWNYITPDHIRLVMDTGNHFLKWLSKHKQRYLHFCNGKSEEEYKKLIPVDLDYIAQTNDIDVMGTGNTHKMCGI